MTDITQLDAEAPAEAIEQPQAEEQVASTEEVVEQKPEIQQTGDPDSVVKRINKYAARAKAAEELAMQEQQKSLLMQAQLQQFLASQNAQRAHQQVDPHAPVPPNKAQYEGRPLDYAESLAQYYVAKGQYDGMQQQRQYQESQREKYNRELQNQYSAKLREAKAQYADWDDALESLELAASKYDQSVLDDLQLSIKSLSNGPEVTRYLGLHPEEFDAIASASPRIAAIKLGEIGVKIKPLAKKLPSAPPPPKQIKGEIGKGAPTEETIDQLARRLARQR